MMINIKIGGKMLPGIFRTEESVYQIHIDGFLHFKNRIYVPNQNNINQIIFTELHDNLFARNPGSLKFITSL